jgi:enamine deaminase RidA (YjgF/YER057c/UK114 family)
LTSPFYTFFSLEKRTKAIAASLSLGHDFRPHLILFMQTTPTHSAEAKAKELGIDFSKATPDAAAKKPYLNRCARAGNLLFLSGQVSTLKGKLGADVTVQQGYDAAKEVGVKLLQALRSEVSSLDEVRVIKLLGCVNSTQDFIEQHLVINGTSDLFHQVFGKDGDGYHARSAVGFSSLPTGVAVEVEAIFELKN